MPIQFQKSSKNLFPNLAESLIINLPKPPDKYTLKSVIQYYFRLAITDDFCLLASTGKQVLMRWC